LETNNKSPLISVIIPHWNGEDILRECLKSLQNSSYQNLEIIVVDNASSDDSVMMLRREFPKVKNIENSENHGYAGGCMDGVPHAKGEIVAFFNNDAIVDSAWLEPMVSHFQNHPEVAVIQPKLLSYFNREKFDFSGAAGGLMDKYGFPFARGRIFTTIENDDGQYDEVTPIFWACGTAFLIRKNVLEKSGGFDRNFFAHFEEIDLCWRIHLMGFEIVCVPQSIVYHRSGYTLGAERYQKKYLNHRNSLLMLFANYSTKNMWKRGFIRRLLDAAGFLFSLFTGDFRRAVALPAAWFYLAAHIGDIRKKRALVRSIRKCTDAEIGEKLYPKSIMLQYFLRGKKEFRKFNNPRS